MRAVLDPNVLISSLLSPTGASAQLVLRWLRGEFEVIVSRRLMSELSRALAYPKIRSRVDAEAATAFLDLLERTATRVEDPAVAARRSRDVDDDYLVALAESALAVLVTGDKDLLALADMPIRPPAAFLAQLTDIASERRSSPRST